MLWILKRSVRVRHFFWVPTTNVKGKWGSSGSHVCQTSCEFNIFVLQKQQNLGRRFGASRIHSSPQWIRLLPVLKRWFCCVDSLLIITPILGFYNCSIFCYAVLCVHCSFAIILKGKRGLVVLLSFASRCHGFVCSLWFWYFLIILTYCILLQFFNRIQNY